MQIVIDIPEDVYKRTVFYREFRDLSDCVATIKALEKGTPLPKGHGRLIDISKIEEDRIEKDNPIIYLTIDDNYTEAISLDYLNNLPTVIEADKENDNADSY